jgi:hypothetical protein
MIFLTRTEVLNKKFIKETHNLLINLCNDCIFHFRTPFLPIHTQFSVSVFSHSETHHVTVIYRLDNRFANWKALQRLSHDIGENIYISNELPSQRTDINVSLIECLCLNIPNTQVTINIDSWKFTFFVTFDHTSVEHL